MILTHIARSDLIPNRLGTDVTENYDFLLIYFHLYGPDTQKGLTKPSHREELRSRSLRRRIQGRVIVGGYKEVIETGHGAELQRGVPKPSDRSRDMSKRERAGASQIRQDF